MKRLLVQVILVALVVVGFSYATEKAVDAVKKAPEPGTPKHIDLAICLDTSGSMRGLIESAKQKLWAVVNELATAKPRPMLRVALYHYGNSGLTRESGWVKQLSPLTDDLDAVYGKLFPLRTHGGTEYVARVVRAATNELDWNMDKGTLRVMFVAGNEPATQDKTYDLQETCKAAVTKGIIVNTIFCGGTGEGQRTGWADAARWADGQYAAIDQDRGTVAITTPYDQKLAELSGSLNATYVIYGRSGAVGAALQKAMDSQAAGLNAATAAERARSKASFLYRNAGWDLIDATRGGKVKLEALAEAELPENMRKMKPAERKAYVERQSKRRLAIQKEIVQLSAKRDAHVKKEMSRRGLSERASLDSALRSAVRVQAEKKNFKFEKKK